MSKKIDIDKVVEAYKRYKELNRYFYDYEPIGMEDPIYINKEYEANFTEWFNLREDLSEFASDHPRLWEKVKDICSIYG